MFRRVEITINGSHEALQQEFANCSLRRGQGRMIARKWFTRFAASALLPWLVLLAASGCKPRAEAEPIWIGHVAPLTGPNSRSGEQSRQAIRLAVEEANKDENGIAGRRIAVLHVDSHDDPNALQSEAVRLITINRVAALLGGEDLVQVERFGRAAQPYDVPVVTPAALPADRLAQNVFSVNASLSFQGTVLARFAATELKVERILLFSEDWRAVDTALAEAFHKEFSRLTGRDVQADHAKGPLDIARIASEAKNLKPQAILYVGATANLAKARAVLQGAGITVPLLFAGDRLPAVEAASKTSGGIYLATPYVVDANTAEMGSFVKKFQDEFHEMPSIDAFLAYDSVRVLLQAMRKAESTITAKAVLAGLNLLMKDGFDSLGGHIFFHKDHSARRPLFVVRLENGKMHDPKRFDPEVK
jgi:branched-chain amino acid transport system substrate-binding protein